MRAAIIQMLVIWRRKRLGVNVFGDVWWEWLDIQGMTRSFIDIESVKLGYLR